MKKSQEDGEETKVQSHSGAQREANRCQQSVALRFPTGIVSGALHGSLRYHLTRCSSAAMNSFNLFFFFNV